MRTLLYTLMMIALLPSLSHAELARYTFDKEHTTILFYVNHVGFSDKIGQFREYDGELWWDKEKPETSSVEITLKPTGIDSGSTKLDEVLQEKDWFDSSAHPIIHFKSTEVKVTGKNTADVTGWMTMLGVKKPLTFKAVFNKQGEHPVNKKQVAGFSLHGALQRSAYGMKNYVPMIGDEVRFHAEVECFEDASASSGKKPK